MSRLYRKYVSLWLGIALMLSLLAPVASAESLEQDTVENGVTAMIEKTLQFYQQARYQKETLGWDPGPLYWTEVVALNASSSQLTDGTAQLPKWIETDPKLSAESKDTEHIRYIFGLLAAGKDPSNAWETKRNLYEELAAQQSEKGSFGGVNKQAWSMLALHTGALREHEVGTWDAAAQQRALEYLLSEEIPGGGFSLAGSTGEPGPDMTAMVLLALADHQDQSVVRDTIKRAKSALHTMQFETGGWGAYGSEDANSTATVVSGLIAIGEDPTSVTWKKLGFGPLDALSKLQLNNGAFAYSMGKFMPVNLKATEQALVALQEIKDGQSVWQQLADPTPMNEDPSIQLPKNVKKEIKNGKIHFLIKDELSGEWQPAKVEKKLLVGEHLTVQISKSTIATEGMTLPSGDKKIVVLENNLPYAYFAADKFTPLSKEWEVRFSAPVLNTADNLKNVTVQTAAGEKVAITVELFAKDQSVKVLPVSPYEPGELYYMTISDVLSAKGTLVKAPIRKIFVADK